MSSDRVGIQEERVDAAGQDLEQTSMITAFCSITLVLLGNEDG